MENVNDNLVIANPINELLNNRFKTEVPDITLDANNTKLEGKYNSIAVKHCVKVMPNVLAHIKRSKGLIILEVRCDKAVIDNAVVSFILAIREVNQDYAIYSYEVGDCIYTVLDFKVKVNGSPRYIYENGRPLIRANSFIQGHKQGIFNIINNG